MKKCISLLTALALICGMMTSFTAFAIQPESEYMYAVYTFNEPKEENRNVVTDRCSKGLGNDALLFGSVKYVVDAEKKSKVLFINGERGSYMEFPLPKANGGTSVSESFTVSMDMKNLTTGDYFNFYVGDGSSNSTGQNYLGFKMTKDILLSASTTTEKKETLEGKGVQNKWVHVDFVIDKGKATMYVDGNNAGSLDGYKMSEINAKVARLGFSAWAADAYAKCYYDNVAIYDKALSAEEIKELPEINDPISETGYKISSTKDVDIQDGMIGLFFEDINYAADGGLYAEMIENRSFEARKYSSGSNTNYDGTYSWSVGIFPCSDAVP